MHTKIADIFNRIKNDTISLKEAEIEINQLFSDNLTECRSCKKSKLNTTMGLRDFLYLNLCSIHENKKNVAVDKKNQATIQNQEMIEIIGSSISHEENWIKKANLKLKESILNNKNEKGKKKKKGSNITPKKKKRKKN